MGLSFLLMKLLVALLVIGFAFIIWVMAEKEAAAVKVSGRIIAILIIVLAVILFIYGAVSGKGTYHKHLGMMNQRPMLQQDGRMMQGGEKTRMEDKLGGERHHSGKMMEKGGEKQEDTN